MPARDANSSFHFGGLSRGIATNQSLVFTPDGGTCNVKDIAILPNPLNLKKKTSKTVTVTLTGAGGCKVEGETVTAKITKGSKRISVAPASFVTDENGEAAFMITARKKTGKAKVSFDAGAVKKTLTVKVTKK